MNDPKTKCTKYLFFGYLHYALGFARTIQLFKNHVLTLAPSLHKLAVGIDLPWAHSMPKNRTVERLLNDKK